MDTRMRDLEQIQECDPQEAGRSIGTIVMASLTLVGVTFAMGVVIGQAAEPAAASNPDPLAALDGRVSTVAATPAPVTETAEPEVEARDLTFPTALTDQEERPEVLAAIAAAAAEEARLDTLADVAPEPAALPLEVAPAAVDSEEITATLPAAVAAGRSRRNLIESARHDPMVAAALPRGTATATAARGSEGEYTLQVISYDQLAAANEFADALRARGHEAFVVSADVPDRGRYYRVRIGPFETKYKADVYRAQFETQERMNTFVVKRPKEGEI